MELTDFQRSALSHSHDNCNLIIVAPTSSGKTTIMPSFFTPTTVYVSPLKSLAAENYNRWAGAYNTLKLTSDDSKPRSLSQYDLILLTNEMLDSLTRKLNSFAPLVNTIILDEFHMLGSPSRGDSLEVGLTRLLRHNPTTRIICLSATVPNVSDFVQWLTLLSDRPTHVVSSTERPVTQTHYFVPIPSRRYALINSVVSYISSQIANHSSSKHLIFVHSISLGKELSTRLGAPFHYSRLSKEARTRLETDFRNGKLNTLVSTSTLSMGVNLPADHGYIVGVTRGFESVSTADLLQMAGRIGRLGLSDSGHVHFLIQYELFDATVNAIKTSDVSPVRSVLPERLHFHLCSFIHRENMTHEDVEAFLNSSFMSIHFDTSHYLDKAEQKLRSHGILDDNYRLNSVGRASAYMYVDPIDLVALRKNLANRPQTPELIAKALAGIPSLEFETHLTFEPHVKMPYSAQTLLANAIYARLSSKLFDPDLTTVGAAYAADFDRIAGALKICGLPSDYVTTLQLMLKYGVSNRHVDLVTLPGIGKAKADKLVKRGICSRQDLLRRPKEAEAVLGKKTFEAIRIHLKNENKTVRLWF